MVKTSKRITVLLADDHTIVRAGLRGLLQAERDIEVVGEAETGREAVEKVLKLRPDVVVMDIAMPLLNGLEATRQIRQAAPETKVLILSAHHDDIYVESVITSEASGYLIKQSSADHLSEAIREVRKGNSFFSPSIALKISKRISKVKVTGLTSREVEVLQLVAEGRPNKLVAAELGISIKTVEKHRDHLMKKLEIHDTAGITRYAIKTGIIECHVPR